MDEGTGEPTGEPTGEAAAAGEATDEVAGEEVVSAEVHAEADEGYPLEDVGEEEEEDEDAKDPDFDAMIQEDVKAGHLRVKVRINSSG